MSYFKQLYARMKSEGVKIKRYRCTCGEWNGPIAFNGVHVIVKCSNPDCKYYGEPVYKPVERR